MACATDIAPTAEGSVRPDVPYYSDTTEHAFMYQATICQILINSTPFYFVSALQKNQNQKKHKQTKNQQL